MPFIVNAYDIADGDAKRAEARDAHLLYLAKEKASGVLLYAVAPLDENGKNVVGSCLILNLDSHEEVGAWLAKEPFYEQGVWDKSKITITPCRVPTLFQNSALQK